MISTSDLVVIVVLASLSLITNCQHKMSWTAKSMTTSKNHQKWHPLSNWLYASLWMVAFSCINSCQHQSIWCSWWGITNAHVWPWELMDQYAHIGPHLHKFVNSNFSDIPIDIYQQWLTSFHLKAMYSQLNQLSFCNNWQAQTHWQAALHLTAAFSFVNYAAQQKTVYRIRVLQIHKHVSPGTVIFGREKAGIMKRSDYQGSEQRTRREVSG